jgi:hypothetical protein
VYYFQEGHEVALKEFPSGKAAPWHEFPNWSVEVKTKRPLCRVVGIEYEFPSDSIYQVSIEMCFVASMCVIPMCCSLKGFMFDFVYQRDTTIVCNVTLEIVPEEQKGECAHKDFSHRC